jgi:MYXO-CTERM domain-containing protein
MRVRSLEEGGAALHSSTRSRARQLAALAALLAASAAYAGPITLVTNGGFEEPVIADGGVSIVGAIPGWLAVVGEIEIQRSAAGSPFEGAQHVELDAFVNSTMVQVITTTPGATYDFSFAYSPRPGVGLGDNTVEVFWDDGLLAEIDADGIGLPDTDWTVYSFTDLPATRSALVITFRATGVSNSLGGYIDAVSVGESGSVTPTAVPVPEPVTWTLLGLGVLGLAALTRRRRRRTAPAG